MTYQSVIDALQDRWFDLTDDDALALINKVHRSLYASFPEIAKSSFTVTLINGTQEYALTGMAQVENVELAGKRLAPAYISELKEREPLWRTQDAGTPERYYVTTDNTGNWMIGLLPKPDAAGSLSVYGSKWGSPVTASDELPDIFPSEAIYVEGCSIEASASRRPSAVALYASLFSQAMSDARQYIDTMTGRTEPAKLHNPRN